MKRKPITPLVIIQIVILLLGACGQKGPLPPSDKIPPSVSLVSPANGAQNVPVNCTIMITFSEEMNASTINEQTITLSTGNGNIPGSVTYSGMTAVFRPASSLSPTTIHTITIESSIADAAGNAMATPFGYIFITGSPLDPTPPGVSATNPADSDQNVPPNAALSVTFTEPVDQSTITFVLSAESATVPCTMSHNGTTAIFTPASPLSYNTLYTATVNSGVKDLAGNTMPSSYFWSFRTGIAPDTTPPSVSANTPGIGATNVSVNTSLTVTFSEAVDQSTITFMLSAGSTTVPCTMTYSGATAIFTPASPLSYNTLYTATVSSQVEDLAGNLMPENYSWSFKTEQQPAFTITASASAGGRISPWGLVSVNNGASQTFTITPDIGYHVLSVLVDGVSAGAGTTYTFTNVTADHTISVSFEIYTCMVTPSVSGGNGSISPSTPQTVNYNEIKSFTLTPNMGYYAVVDGTCSGTLIGNTYTTNAVIADCTVMASFSLMTNTITASAGVNGSISPAGSVAVNYGASQTFTITPNAHYRVADVLVDGASIGAKTSYTFTNVTATHSISASFRRK